ncbi:hypothetical protein DPMN_109794 [Dreissena polymorpha]|uniref:Uncharacterized protein n=1 Tax=Dreissena polymorpha TaxID=45954 RepID=A0A9D4KBE8_DREPO|nr:hypothetical protein DPMN_109794 [Dreissena polymorpha]
MRCGRYLVTVILSVLSILSEHGLMGTANGTSIECASDSDFTFKFYSKICAKSITIAECDLGKEECMMLATTHENKYSVMYTRRGGVLRIKDLDEETVGTYQCYETFNPFNVVSTHILLADYKSPMENCIGNSLKTTGGGRTDKYGHIVMGTLTNTSLECSSNVGLTFRFFSNILPSPVTIAECDFTTESCIMLQTTFKNKFDVFYTGRAGVLYIASLDDETIGEYRCCETFNPTNFISVDINLPYRNDVVNTTYGVPKATESINGN